MNSESLRILRTGAELRAAAGELRAGGRRLALAPTMGNLHAGHESLIRLARRHAGVVCVTLFVNPKQFGAGEDFASYPKTPEQDAARAAAAGAQLLYMPGQAEIYPPGFATAVTVSGLSEELCGAIRPGHFQGVATVVARLLLQAMPDVAVFGEKDFQQLQVIRRMVTDLELPVEIIGAPTVRETDGLALSSRNGYLTPAERAIAPALHRTLRESAAAIAGGADIAATLAAGRQRLAAAGMNAVDYLEMRAEADLTPVTRAGAAPARLFGAVRLGRARLIDNVPVPNLPEKLGVNGSLTGTS